MGFMIQGLGFRVKKLEL